MPRRRNKNVNWAYWDASLKELDARQPPISPKVMFEELVKLGFEHAFSTMNNRRYVLGMWRTPARRGAPEREVGGNAHERRKYGARHKEVKAENGPTSRLCQRPKVGCFRSDNMTARLLGDPPPGRTPWALP